MSALPTRNQGARFWWRRKHGGDEAVEEETLKQQARHANASGFSTFRHAFRPATPCRTSFDLTKIDPWFLDTVRENWVDGRGAEEISWTGDAKDWQKTRRRARYRETVKAKATARENLFVSPVGSEPYGTSCHQD